MAAVFARNVQWGNCGRFRFPHALTTAEWNLYAHKGVRPLRFQKQSVLDELSETPALSFSQQLIEAIREANGSYVLPPVAGDSDQRLRRVYDFVFMDFQVLSSKPKRKKAIGRRSSLGNIESATNAPPGKNTNPKAPIEGVVYLLQGGQYFKIGKSIDPDKRLTQIKLQLPFAVEVVHLIHAAHPAQVESYWHRRFAARRQNGEWFLLTEAEVAEFKSVSQM